MSEGGFRGASGEVCSLGLHVVWCLKHSRRTLGGRVARRLEELLEQSVGERGWRIVAEEVTPNPVHVFVRIGRADEPPLLVRKFRGCAARMLREGFSRPLRLFRACWSYFAASVGSVSGSTASRCIEHQRDALAS